MAELRSRWGGFDLVDHWQQGEFHHDTVFRLGKSSVDLPGNYIVVATNCNGGVKEVLCFSEMPSHGALWKARCPSSDEFVGELPKLHGRATTHHYFDPCDLLKPNARSEYRAEFRERQPGGVRRERDETFGQVPSGARVTLRLISHRAEVTPSNLPMLLAVTARASASPLRTSFGSLDRLP